VFFLIKKGCYVLTGTVTRTIPVGNGGKFTKEAAAIYDIVHEMQQVWIVITGTRVTNDWIYSMR